MCCEEHVHEDGLKSKDVDFSSALNSLKEEIEAIDYYHLRYVTCEDEELKKIFKHNRDEEIEHACMLLEWLRRETPEWNEALNTYLFSEGSITEIEEKKNS